MPLGQGQDYLGSNSEGFKLVKPTRVRGVDLDMIVPVGHRQCWSDQQEVGIIFVHNETVRASLQRLAPKKQAASTHTKSSGVSNNGHSNPINLVSLTNMIKWGHSMCKTPNWEGKLALHVFGRDHTPPQNTTHELSPSCAPITSGSFCSCLCPGAYKNTNFDSLYIKF